MVILAGLGLAALAGLALGAARTASSQTPAPQAPMPMPEAPSKGTKELAKELVAYGERSRFVTSKRIPVAARMSPDMYGLTFHVLTPLQDSVGIITPSSLFYVATHRGSFVPEINPSEHRLMIHGMVDRPLVFTMDELKRLPSVSRIHFIECLGNRAQARHKTVQDTHGLTSNAEWTGVPLSLLLKEVGVQKDAARLLGLKPTTLNEMIKRHSIVLPRDRERRALKEIDTATAAAAAAAKTTSA